MADLVGAVWRRSSRSSTNTQSNCVEVAGNLPEVVGVRDSKDPAGHALTVASAAWSAFTREVKAGAFDL